MKPVAVCLGGHVDVWRELDLALELLAGRPHIVVACNHAGIHYTGQLAAWCTLHPEMFTAWRQARAAAGLNTDYRPIIYRATRRVRDGEVFAPVWGRGSSGLYMAEAAVYMLGAAGAILCGVPMEPGPHIEHGRTWPGPGPGHYRPAFMRAAEAGEPFTSMSGWSAETLGSPTAAWLARIDMGASKFREPQVDSLKE